MLDIQTMFLRMYRGQILDERFLSRHELDGFLQVPMSVETFTLPEDLIDALRTMINSFAGIGSEANLPYNEAVLRELSKNREVLHQWVEQSILQTKLMD